MITVKELSIQYPTILAVDHVSCTFEKGFIYGLIGPNGAGKSSMLKAMVGLISNYSGEFLYGDLLFRENRLAVKKQFGYAPEDIDLIPYLSGLEYLQMIADIRKLKPEQTHLAELVSLLGLEDVQNKLINGYSHGMHQKLSLAAALMGFPPILILDEALNGLDSLALINVNRLIKDLARAGHIIILSSHILELIEQWCDVIYIMHRGRVVVQLNREQCNEIKSRHEQGLSGYFRDLISRS
jgi:ABC-2 type transport system ATP-binding protein